MLGFRVSTRVVLGMLLALQLPVAGYLLWQEISLVEVQAQESREFFVSPLVGHGVADVNKYARQSYKMYEQVEKPLHTREGAAVLVEGSLPYLAHELGNERANSPVVVMTPDKITVPALVGGKTAYGMYPPVSTYGFNKVLLAPMTDRPYFIYASVHETAHAQVLVESPLIAAHDLLSRAGEGRRTTNELFVYIISMEVLANQALDGDEVAEYAFWGMFQRLTRQVEGSYLVYDDDTQELAQVRYAILMNASRGENLYYDGLELDGVAALMNERFDVLPGVS